jgi:hypothetical protein
MSIELTWYWHVHHEVLLEPLSETADKRRKVIKESKTASERATRLLWMQPLLLDPDDLPRAVLDCAKKWCARGGWPASNDALEDMKRAILKCKAELRALHARELPLAPWDWDEMKMVFPGEWPKDEVAAGYNPCKLRGSRVGVKDGWRLLAPEEIGPRAPTPEIEIWLPGEDGTLSWYRSADGCQGSDLKATYRTKLRNPIPRN